MFSPAKLINTKHQQTGTPVTCPNNLKPPSRKLWQKENVKSENPAVIWNKYRNTTDEKWDVIQSPQFVDFSNLPDIGDSFFNKVTVIVSTPNVTDGKLPKTVSDDDTLSASFDAFSLSGIKHEDAEQTVLENCNYKKQQEVKEEYVIHNATIKQEPKIKTEVCNKIKKPYNTVVHPFSFDLRQKNLQERQQERIKKITEEENKLKQFKANPVPKFLKIRPATGFNLNKNNNNNNNNENINNYGNVYNSDEKAEKVQKPIKKNTEVWKKPPFIPSLSRKNFVRPKTPPLKTTARAQERKRFDDIIKEKQKQREEQRQMEIAAKKKQEEEEILKMRKQICFKAQPIRKYKSHFSQVEKRPLTDPTSPITSKRRRKM